MANATAAKPAKKRIALWDNARFLLIVLVVIGHAISTIRTDSALAFGIYVYIYLFHMPAMIFLSGFFSRAEVTPKVIRSTLQLVATWLVWEGIWALLHWFVEGKAPGERFLVSPAWTLWFLVTLATMRILLPYLARMRHPLIISIVLALASGLPPAIGTAFSASRTLVFLPLFMLGYLARKHGWFEGAWFHEPFRITRVAAWGFLALLGLVFAFLPALRKDWRIDKWLTWRDDYEWLFSHATIAGWQPSAWWQTAGAGILVSAALIAVACALTLSLLIVTPRRHSVITAWGTRTLYVYLLHAPVVWILRGTGVVDWFGSFGTPGLIGLMALSVVIAVVLSIAILARLTKPIIEPAIDRLFTHGDSDEPRTVKP